CRAFTDSGAATYAVWEQVRTALTAVQLTGVGRNIAATTVAYERTLDSDGRRVRQQSSSIRSEYVTQPWLAVSPDSLHRGGYVVVDRDNATTYYAPGLDALLSNIFIEDHCFRLTADRGDPNRIGIAFEPNSDRKRVPELRGTLWLDRATSELRSMSFRYANIPSAQEEQAGGEMEFARMSNGAWAISRWNIRMPVVEQRMRSQAFGGSDARVLEVRVSGGELALARRGPDTLWSRPPLVLAGVVMDSSSGAAIGGARLSLSGTQLAATADARGRFAITGVLPGQYTMEVHTPSLDSVSAVHESPLTFTDATIPIELRVPNGQQVGSMLCGKARLEPPGMIVGRVGLRGDSIAPRNLKVVAEWTNISLRANDPNVVSNEKRYYEARGDAHGNFRLCGVPVNTALLLSASADNAGGAPVPVRIPPNGRFARAELTMDRKAEVGAVFSGAVLVDSTNRPIAGAEVVLAELAKMARTDERGAFRISDVPPGEQHVVVRRVGYGPLDTRITFTSNETVNRQIFLDRVTTLDSVVTTARAGDLWIREFEENRRMGFGHFLDRADLAKREGRTTSAVLSEIPGMYIVNGKGTHAWVGSLREPVTLPAASVDADDRAKGATKRKCYAQVYVDNVMVFAGRKSSRPNATFEPLFDINSLAPDQIEAIEYYADRAQAPGRYALPGAVCGVIVIHTRRH
ncbi:MAG TPA: carboxypeptidase regulatory-like domain-containing protein, partial [Gemmatimonadaceae bacterium]|nr:carboxypeptidase regulatory-like domain-containing protein [Gemmatimonadaceae bacterium]